MTLGGVRCHIGILMVEFLEADCVLARVVVTLVFDDDVESVATLEAFTEGGRFLLLELGRLLDFSGEDGLVLGCSASVLSPLMAMVFINWPMLVCCLDSVMTVWKV